MTESRALNPTARKVVCRECGPIGTSILIDGHREVLINAPCDHGAALWSLEMPPPKPMESVISGLDVIPIGSGWTELPTPIISLVDPLKRRMVGGAILISPPPSANDCWLVLAIRGKRRAIAELRSGGQFWIYRQPEQRTEKPQCVGVTPYEAFTHMSGMMGVGS